jgi:putative ABC transport system ATP-binding protein
MKDEAVTLQARSLTRSFDDGETRNRVVNDVSLALNRREVTLLMGPSGSGKSTLLALLSGLLHPDYGEVLALGRDLWKMTDTQREEFRRENCGFIFQGYNLFPALTARQQLEIVLRWGSGASADEARRRADRMLDELGLANKAHLRPAQLSGGEKQRVAIGRALIKEPTFCFADEPTSALDWKNGEHVIELLRAAAREKESTILIVAHDTRIIPYADHVFHMEDGSLKDAVSGMDTDLIGASHDTHH